MWGEKHSKAEAIRQANLILVSATARSAARALQALSARAKCDLLRFSDSFPNANVLLAECSRRGLEGSVAKRKDAPY
jgi:hypothetical protein